MRLQRECLVQIHLGCLIIGAFLTAAGQTTESQGSREGLAFASPPAWAEGPHFSLRSLCHARSNLSQAWPAAGFPLLAEQLLRLQQRGYLCHSGQRGRVMVNKNTESEVMTAMGCDIMFVCKLTNTGGKWLQGRDL